MVRGPAEPCDVALNAMSPLAPDARTAQSVCRHLMPPAPRVPGLYRGQTEAARWATAPPPPATHYLLGTAGLLRQAGPRGYRIRKVACQVVNSLACQVVTALRWRSRAVPISAISHATTAPTIRYTTAAIPQLTAMVASALFSVNIPSNGPARSIPTGAARSPSTPPAKRTSRLPSPTSSVPASSTTGSRSPATHSYAGTSRRSARKAGLICPVKVRALGDQRLECRFCFHAKSEVGARPSDHGLREQT